jgi:SSS family solute:Na+ symporter
MYGLYSKKITKASVWASYIVGVGFTLANIIATQNGNPIIESPINAGAATMIAGLIIVPIVSLITPKPDQKKMDELFECYNKTVVVHSTTSLEEEAEEDK